MKLSNNEKGDFTDVVVLDFSDLNTIKGQSSSQEVIASIPAGGAVELVTVYEAEALAGATDITFDIGTTSADPDEFIDALDVDAMTAPVSNSGDAFTAAGTTEIVGATNAATDILLEVNGTTANLTAGKVVIGLRILDLGRFA